MFTRKLTLFRLSGFAVNVDASWLFLAVLVSWTLAAGVFPSMYPGFALAVYWWMGILGALGLFASIVLHEFGHALVARRFGIPIKDITLFIFGGVSEMTEEPKRARDEFFMAIAGPLTSVLLAVILYVVFAAMRSGGEMSPTVATLGYLAWLNGLLAVFNMLPAFPLDGGRVLRSALWGWKGNLKWSTRIASEVGSAFGIVLIVLGVVSLIQGSSVGGLWWILIGFFLHMGARASYRQVLIRKALEGESLRRFMQSDPVTVRPDISVQTLVDDYIYNLHFRMFPVTDERGLLGCVTAEEVKAVPREEWAARTVGEIMKGPDTGMSISAAEDPMKVLALMNKTGNRRLLVVDDGQLAGIVSLSDLLKFLSLKIDLESGEALSSGGPPWKDG